MIRSFAAVAFNSFREARRNRVSVVVAAFALALLFASSLVTDVTVYTFDRVLTDFGLGVMSLTLVLLTIFLSCGQLSKEIERRTIYLVVSKPISRGGFLAARFAGNMLTLGAVLLLMSGVFVAQLLLAGRLPTAAHAIAIVMLWFELMVISSVGYAVSSFSSQTVSAVVTTGVYFAGHLAADVYALATKAKDPFLEVFWKAVYYLLPNLQRLNFRPRAAYALTASASEVLTSAAYGTAYAAVMISIAVLLFSRRDFK